MVIGVVSIAIIIVLFTLIFLRVSSQPVQLTPQEPQPLSEVDEITLQRQLQDILEKGNESDCEALVDERYQYACHDFFKIKTKK